MALSPIFAWLCTALALPSYPCSRLFVCRWGSWKDTWTRCSDLRAQAAVAAPRMTCPWLRHTHGEVQGVMTADRSRSGHGLAILAPNALSQCPALPCRQRAGDRSCSRLLRKRYFTCHFSNDMSWWHRSGRMLVRGRDQSMLTGTWLAHPQQEHADRYFHAHMCSPCLYSYVGLRPCRCVRNMEDAADACVLLLDTRVEGWRVLYCGPTWKEWTGELRAWLCRPRSANVCVSMLRWGGPVCPIRYLAVHTAGAAGCSRWQTPTWCLVG